MTQQDCIHGVNKKVIHRQMSSLDSRSSPTPKAAKIINPKEHRNAMKENIP